MTNLSNCKIRNREDIKKYDRILLFGAGNYAAESVQTFGADNVIAIFDNDETKWGSAIEGIPVLSPRNYMEKYLSDSVAIVLSTSSYQYDIAKQLVDVYKVDRTQIFSLCPDYQEERMYNVEDILNNLELINKVPQLLGDKESRDYFYDSLMARMTHDPFYLCENPCMHGAYWYSVKGRNTEIRVERNDRIIDCGAYIGDTAQEFLKMTENTGKVYCFEPFEENYMQLEKWKKENKLQDIVKTYCVAVSDCSNVMEISADEEISTRANIHADSKVKKQVKVELIDNFMDDFDRVDFIKMDVEGEEINALNGARKVIAKYKPKMMISAYHKTSHLWEIPLLVNDICPEYKIYLGHNPKVSFEPEFYFI